MTEPDLSRRMIAGTWAREMRVLGERLRAAQISYQEYRDLDHWKSLVAVWRGTWCDACGKSRNLALHHITYVRLFKELRADCVTLCSTCHRLVHRRCKAGLSTLDPRSPVQISTQNAARAREAVVPDVRQYRSDVRHKAKKAKKRARNKAKRNYTNNWYADQDNSYTIRWIGDEEQK